LSGTRLPAPLYVIAALYATVLLAAVLWPS